MKKEVVTPNQFQQIMLEFSKRTKQFFVQKSTVNELTSTVVTLNNKITALEGRVAELEEKANPTQEEEI